MAIHISQGIGCIFDRGTLPEQILMRESLGQIEAGQVLTWSAIDRAYMHRTGRWVVWALTVRQGWGRVFQAYSPSRDAQKAITPRSDIKAA